MERNIALARELDQVVADRGRVDEAKETVLKRLSLLTSDFESIRAQLELGLGGRSVVQLVFALDRRCIREPRQLEQMDVPALEAVRVAALRLPDRQPVKRSLPGPMTKQVDELFAARRDGLEELQRQYGGLIRGLAALEQEKQRYRDQAAQIHAYLARQLFGFGLQSSPRLGLDTFADLPSSLGWLKGRLAELSIVVRFLANERPGVSFFVLAFLGLLAGLRPRWLRTLQETAELSGGGANAGFSATLWALLATLGLALPLPLFIGWLSSVVAQPALTSDWMWGFKSGLQRASLVVFAVTFASATLRPGGLALVHFKWQPERSLSLRTVIDLVAYVYVPAMVLTISCSFGAASIHFDSLGRVSFLVAHAWTLGVLVRWLRLPSVRAVTRSNLPCWSLVIAVLLLIILAGLGYLITAIMLSLGVIVSLGLIFAGRVLHGLTLRWFLLRRSLVASRGQLDPVEAAPQPESKPLPDGVERSNPNADRALDLTTVTIQIRSLIGAFFTIITALSVITFWSTAFPVVDLARSISLGGFTVLQAVVVLFVVLLATTLVRNLPGLLELTVFRPAQLLPGTRFAVATLVRYAAVAVAAAVVLQVIKVDWAQFGWIAAALSVGLGFGLQEIVANFISGLIILFERPIRVGDIVTVEGTTGMVTKIHMRSTTVVNWDSQEFVVPNKTLITNTLLNWTLSTSVNRVVIQVGVAYGSDVDRALEILLEVAGADSNVLDKPAPIATFEEFAESSLTLILRAHVPDVGSRLATISRLHAEVHRRFADAGIEIAFPQRDIHLRP